MSTVGVSEKRVDAAEKATGRAKYTADLIDRNALVAKVFRSTVANGKVLSVDTSEAEKVPGVIKIITAFNCPDIYYMQAAREILNPLLMTEDSSI